MVVSGGSWRRCLIDGVHGRGAVPDVQRHGRRLVPHVRHPGNRGRGLAGRAHRYRLAAERAATAGMHEVLDALPESWRALERGAPIGVLGWQGYLAGPEGTLAVTTLPVANYAKGPSLRRSLSRGFARALALAETAPREHIVFPVTACVVLLRRRADDEARSAHPQARWCLTSTV